MSKCLKDAGRLAEMLYISCAEIKTARDQDDIADGFKWPRQYARLDMRQMITQDTDSLAWLLPPYMAAGVAYIKTGPPHTHHADGFFLLFYNGVLYDL